MRQRSLHKLSALEIVAQVTNGTVSCEEVARACIDRVEAREPVVRAWAYFDPDQIMRQARALDASKKRGPLHGVPIGVKDVIETCDMPTEMGSPIYRGYRSLADASCVALLRAAGALIFGKTITCEFAGVTPGPTTNPHDSSRTPGGSSSGSAGAVADFMVPLALGTQTGGSVQRPAAYCGVIGYKPTFGLINPQGVKPAAESLDTVGLMARTVEDIELAGRVLTNCAPVMWLEPDAHIRIGLCRTPAWNTADDDARHAVEDAARRLALSGFDVRDIELPAACGDLGVTREIINDYERAHGMAYEWYAHPGEISDRLSNIIRRGMAMPCERYVDALQRVAACRRQLDSVFADVDVLLAPAAQGEAPRGLAHTGDHHFQSIWTQLRTPTITLPTYAGASRMPISIQLICAPYHDEQLIAIAKLTFQKLGRGPMIEEIAATMLATQ